jgi:hypothetical protein
VSAPSPNENVYIVLSCYSSIMIIYTRRLRPSSNGPCHIPGPLQDRKKSPKLATKQEMSGIRMPRENDVLMGRGGKNNQHLGNENLRNLARDRSEAYRKATKKGKSDLSRELVVLMRALDPPGRFLRKDPETSMWEDVGDEIAREKASQVLRDAVSEKNGPLAQTVSPPYDPISRGGFRECNSPSKGVEGNYDPIPIGDPSRSSSQATASASQTTSSSALDHRYQDFFAPYGPATSYIPPLYPSVTPASDQLARKRLRVSATPPTYTFNTVECVSSRKRVYYQRDPGDMTMRSPMHPSFPQSSHGFYSHSFSHRYTTTSGSIPEHRASRSSRGDHRWMADGDSQLRLPNSIVSVRVQMNTHDFDPYNADILSDHEDQSNSPIEYPKRDSA